VTKVIVSKDCGNSPKNLFLEKLAIAFAKGDAKFILSSITEDIRWNMIGEKRVQGRDDFVAVLEQRTNEQVVELSISHVVTHGRAGAVNGTLKLKNGQTPAFCDGYEFGGAKGTSVREITSGVIETK
jgi:hypothetical protein